METYSSSDSNISLDSLETEFKKKSTTKKKTLDENVDTILVPFYEKDVLIKVPKKNKSKDKQEGSKSNINNILCKKESPQIKNYLVNKDIRKSKCSSYLEMFRKQFGPAQNPKRMETEIRSISPEFGDTERESFGEESNNPVTDFFNTEAYNEIYYEKLINQELNNYLERSFEEQLKFANDIRSKSPEDIDDNNLRSISDVSQPRRHVRRATIQPLHDVKLGGLGPDMENIKPRLERARSLQRYSEKVRMENRVRIYKKSVQEDNEKKAERELSARRQDIISHKGRKHAENASYLVNKTEHEKQSQTIRKICYSKSKSANVQRTREREEKRCKLREKNYNNNQTDDISKHKSMGLQENVRERVKSSSVNKVNNNTIMKEGTTDVPPVHISFLVNMGGVRPSTALRRLEEKHRLYQEKVKAFTTHNNNNDN